MLASPWFLVPFYLGMGVLSIFIVMCLLKMYNNWKNLDDWETGWLLTASFVAWPVLLIAAVCFYPIKFVIHLINAGSDKFADAVKKER